MILLNKCCSHLTRPQCKDEYEIYFYDFNDNLGFKISYYLLVSNI